MDFKKFLNFRDEIEGIIDELSKNDEHFKITDCAIIFNELGSTIEIKKKLVTFVFSMMELRSIGFDAIINSVFDNLNCENFNDKIH